MVPYSLKKRKNRGQQALQPWFSGDVEQASEVKGGKNETYISGGFVHAFFGGDVVKAPLSFDDAKGMLCDGLPSFVQVFFLFKVDAVLLDVWGKFRSFDYATSFGIFGA